MLDLKLSDIAAVNAGASKDEGLKRLNEREAKAHAAKLRFANRLTPTQQRKFDVDFAIPTTYNAFVWSI